MYILSAADIRAWDAYTIAQEPIASIDLMERAANAAFREVKQWWDAGKYRQVCILCGPGNNGGDGLAMARMLHAASIPVQVVLLHASRYSADCTTNMERLQAAGIAWQHVRMANDWQVGDGPCLVIDALFGTGLKQPLDGVAAALVERANSLQDAVRIAIDIPSGLFCDTDDPATANAFRAHHTLSFQCLKPVFVMPGMQAFTGQVRVLDIGLHPAFPETLPMPMEWVASDAFFLQPPAYALDTHKAQRGLALLHGGTAAYGGAALLAADGALASGAGLVAVALEQDRRNLLLGRHPEVVCLEPTALMDALVMGNYQHRAMGAGFGWPSANESLEAALYDMLTKVAWPLVLDAGALRMLVRHPEWLLSRPPQALTVCTPHIGEFDALTGKSQTHAERLGKALDFARQWKVVLVLKGPYSRIITPHGKVYVNSTGNPGMAKGGSGDVLSGLLTGLLAQPIPALQAVLLGVYLHGLAGDLAAADLGQQAMQPGQLMPYLAKAWRQLQALHDDQS